MNRKIFFRWLKVIILLYCTIGIVLYYVQDKFLFHPVKLESNYIFHFKNKFEEVKLAVNDTDTLSLVKFFPEDSIRKGLVVYFHGNMNNIQHYAVNAGIFLQKGYEVWMPDYPEYGKSTGKRTEQKMYEQARIAFGLAASVYSSDSIFIYGKSLGTGIATYVASYSSAKALILETPYYSIASLFSHYAPIYPASAMCNYKIPTYKYLQEVKSPVIIFHGTGDDVIPYSNSKRLEKFLKPGDVFVTIKGGGHNTLTNSTQYKNVIDSVFK